MKTTRFKAENNYIVNKITNKIIADSDLSKTGLPEEIIRKYNAVGVYTLVELLGIDEDLEEFVISYFNLNDKRNDIYKLILKYLRKCDEETVGGNPSNMTFDYLQRLDRLNSYITDDELEIVKTSLDQTIIDSDMFKQLRKGIIYDLMVTFQIFKWDNNTYVTRKYFDSIGVKIEVDLYNRICKKVYNQLNELYTVKYINEEVNKYIENSSDDFSSLTQFMKCLPFASFEIVHSTQYYMNKPFEFGGVMVFGGSKQIPSKEVNKYNFVKYLIESNKINSKNKLYEILVDKYGIRLSLGEFNKVLNTIGFNPIPNEIVDISYADKVVENVPKLEVKTQKKAEDVKLESIAKKKVKEVKPKIEVQIPVEEVKLQPETKNTTEEEKQKIEVQASVKEDEKEAITPIEASSVDLNDFVINKGLLKKYIGKNKHVTIPDGVIFIGSNSFGNNKIIENVVIPDGVKEIRSSAFSGCINLKSVILPSTLIKIANAVFSGCTNLYFKELPSSLKELASNIMFDSSVKCLILPDKLEEISGDALNGQYEELYIPASLKSIKPYIELSENLNKIVVDSNNEIYDSRDNCNAIIETKTNKFILGCASTIIPSTVTTIDIEYSYAVFERFMSISILKDNPVYYSDKDSGAIIEKDSNRLLFLGKNKQIPQSVKIIGKNSINSDIDCLVVPEGVEEIEEEAFYLCESKNYIFPSSLKKIDKDVLIDRDVNTINIYANRESINKNREFTLGYELYSVEELIWIDSTDEIKDNPSRNLITLNQITTKRKDSTFIKFESYRDVYYITILNDGTFYLTSHSKDICYMEQNEYVYYKKLRIGYIEFSRDITEVWYDLYEDDRKIDNCIHLKMELISSHLGGDNFLDKSEELSNVIHKIIEIYGKSNVKLVNKDGKAINGSNNAKVNYNDKIKITPPSNQSPVDNTSNTPHDTSKYPSMPKKAGCYIATCVYGSYDCKEVWRLRRYRDLYLDNHWFGRAFIKLYYFISPKLVKLFGNQKWFKNISKKLLDKKISKLIDKGYEDTPYNDKY